MRFTVVLFTLATQFWPQTDATGQESSGPNHDRFYAPGPFAQRHDDVPHGELVGPLTLESAVFPTAEHRYWVYVPAQYDPEPTAPSMI